MPSTAARHTVAPDPVCCVDAADKQRCRIDLPSTGEVWACLHDTQARARILVVVGSL